MSQILVVIVSLLERVKSYEVFVYGLEKVAVIYLYLALVSNQTI